MKQLQARFGLTYHVPYALKAEELVGLRGKDVLEVGGSLPKDFVLEGLGCRRWIAVEEMDYWRETLASGDLQGTPPTSGFAAPIATCNDIDALGSHAVLNGRIDDLSPALHEQFDVVFSIAAFEHIDRMPLALEKMFKALRPGGAVFSMYSPIWSAHDGHHLPNLTDGSGRTFSFDSSPIPRWGHLTMRPPQLYQYLLSHTDVETASKIVYYVYHSPHINRLFTEDYMDYFKQSPFDTEKVQLTFPMQLPDDTRQHAQKILEQLHPGRRHFMNNGIMAVLRKPGFMSNMAGA